jgi:hypothetical protein
MKKNIFALLLIVTALFNVSMNAPHPDNLKIVIIRHGEKPPIGDNLNCQGVNRSLLLPALITTKFGVPDYVYVPAISQGKSTVRSRMFQTVTPLVAKYNLKVNSTYDEQDFDNIATDLKTKTGTVLLVWEHKAIVPLVKALGITAKHLTWPDGDFDTIYIITFPKGIPTLTIDKENLKPSVDCNY